MPYMSKSINSKDFYEEGETLTVNCFDGVAVGQTLRDHVIQCSNNTWNTTALRCSHIHNISSINIFNDDKSVANKNLEEQEFLYLSDSDPMTCVMLRDVEKWILHLSDVKYISNIALIASFIGNPSIDPNQAIEITLSLPDGQVCHMEETNVNQHSTLKFIVYKCPESKPYENVTIDLKANHKIANICGLEVFTLITDDCGKPEIPLYSYTNQMRIQNGTKIAEYVCAKGYQMKGSPMRTCGSDGLWIPSEPPICIPEITCKQSVELVENFTYEYKDFDLFGNALPDVSTIMIHCSNRSLVAAPLTELYCQPDGNWSQIDYYPICIPRSHVIISIAHDFLNHKHLIYFGGSGLVILFLGSFVILFHMRRLAKKISRQMREKSYLAQEKSLPHYNNETNYQDLTNLFSQHDAVNSQPASAVVEVSHSEKY
ncbi:uncharacterized protein LOC128961488 [Oppia nitens]|uniref:uncharacterized protein LOC128961488 n=1 Tax=Oppia nitens TaxID=1686743 RepID=UPI0023DC8989|nr:uncharacterized protein LOC128961488 [Oppia nitens]